MQWPLVQILFVFIFSGRIFERGRRKGVLGQLIGVQSNAGFMSQNVDGVIIGMKSLLEKDVQEMSDIDYKVHPIPWNESLFRPQKKRLKIGQKYSPHLREYNDFLNNTQWLKNSAIRNCWISVRGAIKLHPFGTTSACC